MLGQQLRLVEEVVAQEMVMKVCWTQHLFMLNKFILHPAMDDSCWMQSSSLHKTVLQHDDDEVGGDGDDNRTSFVMDVSWVSNAVMH